MISNYGNKKVTNDVHINEFTYFCQTRDDESERVLISQQSK